MSERIENPGPGIHRGYSYDEYAAWPGIRKSSLWPLVTDTPAHYKHRLENPKEPTPAMRFGTAFHTIVLEPERFEREYGTGPINPKTDNPYGPDTKKTLEWKKETGLEVVSLEDMEALKGMAEAVFAHDAASEMLKQAETEVSALWESDLGPLLQGRLDLWIESACLFADLKSTKSAHPRAFARDAVKYGIFAQMAMYRDGVKAITGKEPYMPQVIACEKDEPFVVAVYQIEDDALEFGREQYRNALKLLGRCELEYSWPAYPGVELLAIPKWAKAEMIFD